VKVNNCQTLIVLIGLE